MSDPVASKSPFLCLYMSNHPDTLVAYVKYFGKIPGDVSSARMKSIDCKGMHLSYTRKNGEAGSVHVKFIPPLASYDELKPRLLAMKTDAQEALGMLKFPKITSFRFPSRESLKVAAFFLASAYFCCAPPHGTALPFMSADVTDMLFMPARQGLDLIGFQPTMKAFAQFIGVIHCFETLYTGYLCSKYVEGPFVMAAYLCSTMLVGAPLWKDLHKRIQEMRIESVVKTD